jgi:DNA-binding Lrp family transcriptional regulator
MALRPVISRNEGELDHLDRRVIVALLAHPRATVSQLGRAVRSSETTVSRRLSRLLRDGVVRVIGVLDMEASRRARSVFVRLRCSPGTASRSAYQLAQWEEARSVKLLTGSVDCVAELVYSSKEHLLRLMMEELPRLDGVVATSSTQVIRRFSTPHGWDPGLLPDDTVRALRAARSDQWDERAYPADPVRISELDERLIALLAEDGRLGWQELAQRCDVMPSTVRRHVETLMSRGLLRMRTVVEPEVVGLPVDAFVWLSISPTQLGAAGRVLADHPNVLMIAATTGDRNLCGEIAVASDRALYDFLADTVGHLPGLFNAEVTTELLPIKRAGKVRRPAGREDRPGEESRPTAGRARPT